MSGEPVGDQCSARLGQGVLLGVGQPGKGLESPERAEDEEAKRGHPAALAQDPVRAARRGPEKGSGRQWGAWPRCGAIQLVVRGWALFVRRSPAECGNRCGARAGTPAAMMGRAVRGRPR